jgi:flavin-dependent dehydrogenase
MEDMTDVFIVGGGPAGLAAAIAARERGFRVTVADGCRPPIDKACGEGLMPDSLVALRRLGITVDPEEGAAFQGIRFRDADSVVEACFHSGVGIGMRRPALHARMMEHTAACGVTMLWETPVSGLWSGGVIAAGRRVRARWIIGADGSSSMVRRWAGLESSMYNERRFGYRRHFRLTPWTDYMEVYWGRTLQVYTTPVGPEEICVAVLSRDPGLRLAQALREFPHLAARLEAAEPADTERGAVTAMHRLHRVCGERIALLGDASGSVDAITGEGLGLAFRQAVVLADALEAGDLALYQAAHRRLSRRPSVMARLMLALDGRAALRRRTLRIFASEPRLFAQLLAVHVGARPAADLAATGLALSWRLLTA